MRGIPARALGSSQVSSWFGVGDIQVPSRSTFAPPATDALLAWFDANSLTGLGNGDTLPATLSDLSGAGNDGTRVNSPTYVTAATALGGSAMSTAGSGYYSLPATVWSGATEGTLIAYAKAPASGIGNGPFQSGANDFSFWPYAGAYDCYEGSLTNTRYGFTATMGLRGVWRIYEVSHDGTDHKVYLDGTQQNSSTVAFTAPSYTKVLAGNFGTIGTFLTAAFLAYDRALSSDERSAVITYLTSRYGVTGTA